MRVSMNMLKQYVDVPLSPEEYAGLRAMVGKKMKVSEETYSNFGLSGIEQKDGTECKTAE